MKSLVFAILESIFQAEDQDVKITKILEMAFYFYNPERILVNLINILGGIFPPIYSCQLDILLIKFYLFNLKN